ncbi:hypothetical protein ACQY1Q_03520 [Tenacibaculum sp. TC6]|uniref:hypothetical protein n=1 Tax=Tenacibaculum sp. TC6 TaxID=3423223 RepID=UPI003D35E186
MGTSQSISPGVSGDPNWGQTSSAVSNFANSIDKEIRSPSILNNPKYNTKRDAKLKNILNKYIKAAGGRRGMSSGKSSKGGKAAITTASSFGGFLNIVSSGNLNSYAEDKGLTNFATRSKEEIINFLLDDICGATTNFDEGAAKSALDKLLNELLNDVNSSGEIDELLQSKIAKEGIDSILISFFGTYIFEHLSQPIEEKLFERKGEEVCNRTMDEIRDFIDSELETINSTEGIDIINWDNPSDCERISKKIFDNVLKVFNNE